MKNAKFKIGQEVIFNSGINAPELTKVISFKYSELSKIWLYKLERSPGVFFSEKTLSEVSKPKPKNEDVYSMQKIERIIEDEENQFFNRHNIENYGI